MNLTDVRVLQLMVRDDYQRYQTGPSFSKTKLYKMERQQMLREFEKEKNIPRRHDTQTISTLGREVGAKNKAFSLNLSDTDSDEYTDYPGLKSMDPVQKRKRMLMLWRTVINFTFAASIFISQLAALKVKLQMFGQ